MQKMQIGDKAPEFSLPNDQNQLVSLKDFLGKKVVLYFYPKDDTPGCTKEACDFRDHIQAFDKKATVILGISKDGYKKHQAFKQKYALPFMLLTDADAKVCIAYDVVDEKSLFGKSFLGITRSTFLIDEKGYLRAIWRSVKVKGHVDQVLHEL